MSWDIHLHPHMSWDIGIHPPHDKTAWNITYNLSAMLVAAGTHPEHWDAKKPSDLAADLDLVRGRLLADPEGFKQHNPENGWGSFDSLLDDLTSMVDALRAVDDDWTVNVY